jgi:hypothetical protein
VVQTGVARIVSPAAGAVVSSPLVVEGVAPGPWYFEASLPISIEDEDGRVLAQAGAEAQGEWMTTADVPFRATIAWPAGESPAGRVVASRVSMESGDELERVSTPIRFAPPPPSGASGPSPHP